MQSVHRLELCFPLIIQLCWRPQAAPTVNKQKVWMCCHFNSTGSKEAEGASRLNLHLHSEAIPWKWYKFLFCNPTVVDQISTQLIHQRLKMPINHSTQHLQRSQTFGGSAGMQGAQLCSSSQAVVLGCEDSLAFFLSQTRCSCAQVFWAD